jgi:putative two-component system response regulator
MTSSLLFVTIAVLTLSLLAQFLPPYGERFLRISTIHWPLSLGFLLASIVLFGAESFLPPVFLTLANTFSVASIFSLGLMLIALDKQDPRWGLRVLSVSMLLYAVVFEMTRQQEGNSFPERTLLNAMAISASALFLTYAVSRYKFRPLAWSLHIMAACAIFSGLLLAKRVSLIYWDDLPASYSLGTESGLSLTLRWIASISIYMTFLMMRNHLGERIQKSLEHERERAEEAMLSSLRYLASAGSMQTENHALRLQELVKVAAQTLRLSGRYAAQMTEQDIQNMMQACVLHDIGNIVLPDALLLKSYPLTKAEMKEMMTHTTLGERVLSSALTHPNDPPAGSLLHILDTAAAIAGAHHERWDGTGYPRQLSGEAIPLSARLVAVADAIDTCLSSKVHKEIWSLDEALAHIEKQSGTAFDPDVVNAFLINSDAIQKISTAYRT